MEGQNVLLKMEHISKSFGKAVIALDDVQFELRSRRDPCALRRKRSRKIYSDQGADRRGGER